MEDEEKQLYFLFREDHRMVAYSSMVTDKASMAHFKWTTTDDGSILVTQLIPKSTDFGKWTEIREDVATAVNNWLADKTIFAETDPNKE